MVRMLFSLGLLGDSLAWDVGQKLGRLDELRLGGRGGVLTRPHYFSMHTTIGGASYQVRQQGGGPGSSREGRCRAFGRRGFGHLLCISADCSGCQLYTGDTRLPSCMSHRLAQLCEARPDVQPEGEVADSWS